MELFIAIFVSIFIGYRLGWTGRETHAKRVLKQYAESLEKDQIDSKRDGMVELIIERHPEGFFAYHREDNSFAAYGETQEMLEGNLIDRYPGKRFAIDPSNVKEIGFELK